MDSESIRAAVGPHADYYLGQFEKFERAGRWAPTWNWPAFFCSTAWFSYRRMPGYSALNFFLPIVFMFLAGLASARDAFGLVFAGYLATAYVLIPMYANALLHARLRARVSEAAAAEEARKKRLLRPTSASQAMLAALLGYGLPTLLALVAVPMYADYTPRAKISEGISLAGAMKGDINDFYAQNKRLPAAQEAQAFTVPQGKYTRSVVYDAQKKMITVTMKDPSFEDRRLALYAEEKGGNVVWTCRTIDIEQKYLPGTCRD